MKYALIDRTTQHILAVHKTLAAALEDAELYRRDDFFGKGAPQEYDMHAYIVRRFK